MSVQPSILDEIDHQIVDLLVEDGRRTFADMGTHVSLSAPAVKRRVQRLEERRVIRGYTAVVDDARMRRVLEAFTELTFAGDTKVDDIQGVAVDLPEVQAVFTTAGDPDALVWLRINDVDHLKRVIDRLRRSGKVTGTKTLMVLGTWTRGAAWRGR